LSIPPNASNAAAAVEFVRFLLGENGRRLMRSEYLDVLEVPTFVGRDVPAALDSLRLGSARRTAYTQ
jgi:hypothetical protein